MSQTTQIQQSDSIESQDPNVDVKQRKEKTRRPASECAVHSH